MGWISWYGVDKSGNRKDSQFLWIFAYAVNYSLVYNRTASEVAVIKVKDSAKAFIQKHEASILPNQTSQNASLQSIYKA